MDRRKETRCSDHYEESTALHGPNEILDECSSLKANILSPNSARKWEKGWELGIIAENLATLSGAHKRESCGRVDDQSAATRTRRTATRLQKRESAEEERVGQRGYNLTAKSAVIDRRYINRSHRGAARIRKAKHVAESFGRNGWGGVFGIAFDGSAFGGRASGHCDR